MDSSTIYVAKESAVFRFEGEHVVIHKGVTRVREGHPILEGRADLFEPLTVQFDTVEYRQNEPEQPEPDKRKSSRKAADE